MTIVAAALLALSTVGGALGWFALWLPGKRHAGALAPLTADERILVPRLRTHIDAIASEPHNTAYPAALERAAVYIERTLSMHGHAPVSQVFSAGGHVVRNIATIIPPASRGSKADGNGDGSRPPVLVVGAHYDSAFDAPGANDNGTGTALVLELARLLRAVPLRSLELHLVLFVNEEPPWFGTQHMGSVHYASALKAERRSVRGMISLETLGAFSDAPGSQQYPAPLGLGLPATANFIAFVALPGSRAFLHDVVGSFRRHTPFPTIGGVAPGWIEGLGWSDHAPFAEARYEAVMITDTALFRYAHYHKPTDTPDKVDYERLARLTTAMARVIHDLDRSPPGTAGVAAHPPLTANGAASVPEPRPASAR